MQRLFAFLFARRAFLTFLFLQVLCFWLIVQNNTYHSAAYYSSSNQISGVIYEAQQNMIDYFNLTNVNRKLAEENARLKKISYEKLNSSSKTNAYSGRFLRRLNFVSGKVINNSIYRSNNSLTLNIGALQGVKPGMGVITETGIVGRVKACSDNFSTVTSILHPNMHISCIHKPSNYLCEANWNTENPLYINLKNIPRHIKVSKGDTVLTSSFNTVFPENILLGIVDKVRLEPDQSFYTIKVKLGQDMGKLSYVYVVSNKLKNEQQQLEKENDQ